MKSALCSPAPPGAISAVEKPRKKLYHGVFIAEVIPALPHFQPPPPSPAWGPGSGFRLPYPRSSRCPRSPGGLGTAAAGTPLHRRGTRRRQALSGLSALRRWRAVLVQNPFFSKGRWGILTFGGRIRSLCPAKQVPSTAVQPPREDPRPAAPRGCTPQLPAISLPPTSGSRAAGQERAALGDSQLLGTSRTCTLLPPGGTKKSCQRRN